MSKRKKPTKNSGTSRPSSEPISKAEAARPEDERVQRIAETIAANEEERAKLEAAIEERSRFARLISVAVASLTLFVAIASLIAGLSSGFNLKPFASKPGLDVQLLRDVGELQSELKETQESLAKISNAFNALSTPDTKTDALKQVAAIKENVGKLTGRIDAIDAAIVENPTKALSVPLLRQDLENLKGDYLTDRENATKEIDRIYDQNKWFIGLMFTMALGIIGLAVSNFIQLKKPKTSE